MPYYWKRGLVAGTVIWIILSFLVSRLDMRYKQMDSNVQMEPAVVYPVPPHRTDFGMFLGLIVFGLFCAVPGPHREPRRQEGPPT